VSERSTSETIEGMSEPFSEAERRAVYRAIYERRDVRAHFVNTPVPDAVLGRILNAAHHAPSVGFMQPWDFIVIRDEAVRRAVHDNFARANRDAASSYSGERRDLYGDLKLEGILRAPVSVCVTCDRSRNRGHGLGRQSSPETDVYSTVCAIENLWLAARAESLGVGWVSILDFEELKKLLGIPEHVTVIAYLCVGYVSEFGTRPDLEERGWEGREDLARLVHFDAWGSRDEEQVERLF
jgi:5,6-dimethylbenzimidazole synthase